MIQVDNYIMNRNKTIAEQVGANQIYWNRGELITEEWINQYGESSFIGSLYFSYKGIDYRVSDHELQGKRYLQLSDNSFICENIEMIFERLPNGYILTNTFFNTNI